MDDNKIILTQEEIEVIEKNLRGEFSPFKASDKERELLNKVIQSADSLLSELDAYDEIGDSLLQWYYDKYKAQE